VLHSTALLRSQLHGISSQILVVVQIRWRAQVAVSIEQTLARSGGGKHSTWGGGGAKTGRRRDHKRFRVLSIFLRGPCALEAAVEARWNGDKWYHSQWNARITEGSTVLLEKFTIVQSLKKYTKLRGLSPRADYTDRATAACRRSYCRFLRIEVPNHYGRILGFLGRSHYIFFQVAPQLYS
jgi:hypothetical protein